MMNGKEPSTHVQMHSNQGSSKHRLAFKADLVKNQTVMALEFKL